MGYLTGGRHENNTHHSTRHTTPASGMDTRGTRIVGLDVWLVRPGVPDRQRRSDAGHPR